MSTGISRVSGSQLPSTCELLERQEKSLAGVADCLFGARRTWKTVTLGAGDLDVWSRFERSGDDSGEHDDADR